MLVIREMQIKITMSYQLTPVKMAFIKKLKDILCWLDVKEREPSYIVGRNVGWSVTVEAVWRFLKRLKIEV